MADLSELQSSDTTKIVGSDAAGVEQTPVQSTAGGALFNNLRTAAGAELGTVGNPLYVRASDGADAQALTTTGEVKVVDGLSTGVYGRVSVPSANVPVEMKVGASRLANRKFLQVVTNNTGFYYGLDNTVTTTSGTPLANGQILTLTLNPDSTFSIWLVRGTAGGTVQVIEAT